MNPELQPTVLGQVGPLVLTDTLATSVGISLALVIAAIVSMRVERARGVMESVYEGLERAILDSVQVDARPLVPLVLTQWLFIAVANLAGLLPGVASPTRDLSVTCALALIAFGAGHVYAFRARGMRYLRHYLEPNPLLLPFNIIGELTRTFALAMRLFGNMLSAHIVAAVLLGLAGLLIPLPLLLLGVVTAIAQAYIFGVLTLVFTASSMQVAERPHRAEKGIAT